ncbi:MAG: PilZ domain-containing protein [Deltaproteobacteria bacterium]|nr:MAG: PilZ domain-containing protein [Deltaproteobacteria bacterium]
MEGGRSKRRSLRVPVNLDVRFDLADGSILKAKIINLGTEGIFVKSAEPLHPGESVGLEFLLPGTLNSIQLAGEVMYSRTEEEGEGGDVEYHVAGIKFSDLEEPYHGMIRDYTLKMLDNEELLRDGGILLVLDDLRNLPPEDRLKAYHILIKKGTGLIR